MPSIRIGFSSDFTLKNQLVGIGTDTADVKLEVVGVLKGDFNISGVTTLTSYAGFIPQKQSGDGVTLTTEVNTLSEDIIVGLGKTFTVSIGSTVNIGTLESVSIQSHFSVPDGGISERVDNPIEGSVRFNDDLNTLEFYNGVEWRQFTVTGASGRGVFGGGESPVVANIDLINIQSQGNATNFGDLSVARRIMGGFSSNIRGLWGGGSTPSNSDVIDYVTIASEGNAIDFGNLTAATDQTAACSSSTRGLIGGGESPGITNVIGYVEISTIGNALDFGDLSENKRGHSGMSSPTRGFFCGGNNPGTTPRIDVVTIASKGNAIKFGDRISSSGGTASGSNATRGIISDTASSTNKLSFVTLASDGNASFFGELSAAGGRQMTTSSQTRVVIALGEVSPALTNTLEYVSISTLGNSQDFGDLTSARKSTGGCSDSHGGLGGF
jgi:hypothetical protein